MPRWTPSLPEGASRFIITVLSLQAIIRGVDYLFGDKDNVTQALEVAEQAMPLPVWGGIFIVGGALALIGVRRRSAKAITTAACWLIAAYGSLAWSLLLKMLDRATPWEDFWGHVRDPSLTLAWLQDVVAAFPWDGWRTPTTFLAAALIWAAIGWGVMIKAKAWEVSHGPGSRADP